MHRPTEWEDRIFIAEDGAISRMLTAYYKRQNKKLVCNVYIENEYGEACCQNLYCSTYGGYVVAFPGEVINSNRTSYYYDERIAEEEGFGECDLLPRVGTSDFCTEEDRHLVCEKYPKFRYVLNKFKGCKTRQTLMHTLMLWKEHPECELVLACGYESVVHNKVFWKLSKPKLKEVCGFMQRYKYLDRNLNEILYCIKLGKDYDLNLKYIDWIDTRERKVITFEDFKYLNKLSQKQKEYSLQTTIRLYKDYIEMLNQTEHDIQSEYWRHPKDLYGKHDELVAELNRKKEAEKLALEKTRGRNLNAIQKRFEKYNLEIAGFRIFVTTDYQIWKNQAKGLHQCIVANGYYDKVADGLKILVFIQKDNRPVATAEVFPNKTVGQFYADELDRDNCLPTKEVKSAFNKWMQLVPKSKFKKETLL